MEVELLVQSGNGFPSPDEIGWDEMLRMHSGKKQYHVRGKGLGSEGVLRWAWAIKCAQAILTPATAL
jgi:hypothetical protein